MTKKIVLPQPSDTYRADEERIRNRELENQFKIINQKLSELEERIKALEP